MLFFSLSKGKKGGIMFPNIVLATILNPSSSFYSAICSPLLPPPCPVAPYHTHTTIYSSVSDRNVAISQIINTCVRWHYYSVHVMHPIRQPSAVTRELLGRYRSEMADITPPTISKKRILGARIMSKPPFVALAENNLSNNDREECSIQHASKE